MRAFATSLTFNVVGAALSGIAVLLVVATLAPDAWGSAAAILGAGQFIGAAISFGSQTERVRRYSRLEVDQFRERVGQELSTRAGFAALLAVLAGFLFLFWPAAGATLLAAAGVFMSLGTTNHLIAQMRYVSAGLVVVAEKVVVAAVVVGAILVDTLAVETLPSVVGLAGLIVGVGVLARIRPRRRMLVAALRPREVLAMWTGSFYIGVASLAPSALLLDVIIVATIAGSTEAGIFALASRLTAPLSVAATAVVAVLLPHMASSKARTIPRPSRRGVVALLVLVIILSIIMFTTELWVTLLFGSDYIRGVWPIRFYILNVIVILGTRAFVTVLQAWDDERFVGLLVVAQVLAALIGVAVGAHLGAAFGASLSVLATNLVLLGCLGFRVKRLVRVGR